MLLETKGVLNSNLPAFLKHLSDAFLILKKKDGPPSLSKVAHFSSKTKPSASVNALVEKMEYMPLKEVANFILQRLQGCCSLNGDSIKTVSGFLRLVEILERE